VKRNNNVTPISNEKGNTELMDKTKVVNKNNLSISLLDRVGGGGDGKPTLPWSSPTLESSPTDQLIAAILDGDIQGLRTVVRSKGGDLKSEFWVDLIRSILPYHRAVSGLHFHGSDKLLVATIETLSQLSADINYHDSTGNNVLHKAIQVCTSNSIVTVVKTLIARGCKSNYKNKENETPLHYECKSVRTASVDVINILIQSGADVNGKGRKNNTPLSIILQQGAISSSSSEIDHTNDDSLAIDIDDGNRKPESNAIFDKGRSPGRRVWVKAAECLIKKGAVWDSNWNGINGSSQLYLLLSAFPPAREDISSYRYLLTSALEAGCSPMLEDEKGRNSLFILCEQMAGVSLEVCPEAGKIMRTLLDSCGNVGVGGSDRSGRTVFDIRERVPLSCLSSVKSMLINATLSNTNQNNHSEYELSSLIPSIGITKPLSRPSFSKSINLESKTDIKQFTNKINRPINLPVSSNHSNIPYSKDTILKSFNDHSPIIVNSNNNNNLYRKSSETRQSTESRRVLKELQTNYN
jgi:hypothetical protein